MDQAPVTFDAVPRRSAACLAPLGPHLAAVAGADPRFAHTADIVIEQGGERVFAAHLLPGELRNIRCVTTSVVALLVGAVLGPDVPTGEVVEGADVTLHHLLSMQRGAVCRFEDIDEWPVDPDGHHRASGDLALSAGAMARLGEVILRRGRVGAHPVVAPAWVDRMCLAHAAGGSPEPLRYGYGVWVGRQFIRMAGWASQSVTVLPSLDAVIVLTGREDRLTSSWAPAHQALDAYLHRVVPSLGIPEVDLSAQGVSPDLGQAP